MSAPNIFFRQMQTLPPKGIHVVSILPPPFESYQEFVAGFRDFLDETNIKRCHILGSGLGGFLAQNFARVHPSRVISLILVNSFCSTESFKIETEYVLFIPYGFSFSFFPLRAPYSLFNIPDGSFKNTVFQRYAGDDSEPSIASATSFEYSQFDSIPRSQMISRLTLQATPETIIEPPVLPKNITVLTSFDVGDELLKLSESLVETFNGCRSLFFKTGGLHPYISRTEEFNMYLLVHLRTYIAALRPKLARPPVPRADQLAPDDSGDEDPSQSPPASGAAASG
jgi:maspardin